jgi:ribosomal protein S25
MPSVNVQGERREATEDEIVLGVLDVIERDRHVTQRAVARELGIALGLANAYLKRCARKGLIKVSQIPSRRYAYYLTARGFTEKSRLTAKYLLHSFSFFRRARAQCGEVFKAALARDHRRLALIGDGDLAEIASLVAREHSVEIVGIVPLGNDATVIASNISALSAIDGVIVTALVSPREAFDAAVAVLGSDRVYAPALLRLRQRPSDGGTGKAA